LTAKIEIASVTGGPALAASAATLHQPGDEARRIALAPLATGSLPPGDYLVRAIVSLNGRPAATVSRTLRKVAN
jgi:hypothetical protein